MVRASGVGGPTNVGVPGVDDGDGRVDGRVIKDGDLVVAGGEARGVIVHVLDHQQDVRLARPTAAVRRFCNQVVLHLRLPVQNRQSEELTWHNNH